MLMERIHNIGKISVVGYTQYIILVNQHWFAMMLKMQSIELTLLTTDVRYTKDQRNF